ncbi:MAG: CopD family protein [Nitrospirae bacterium]|nr:CopD family protein [Nitrospirota bacterium]
MVWLHLLAAIAWIGGMIFISLVLTPALGKYPPDSRWEFFRTVGTATKAVGWIAILILLSTGLLNVLHLQIQWNTFIGRLLILKLSLVLLVIFLSAFHDFILGPLLTARQQTAAAQDPSARRLRLLVSWLARINLMLALTVVYLAVLIARA